MQIFDRIMVWLLAAVLMFVCPVLLMLERKETVAELAVMEVVTTCTEQWKQSGKLTRSSYEDAVEKLAALGSFRLEVDYRKRVAEPVWKDGQITGVSTAYLYVPWEEILQEMYEGSGFCRMYREDLLTVRVLGDVDTGGGRLLSRLFGRTPHWEIRYGGMITGESWESSSAGWNSDAALYSDRGNTVLEPERTVCRPDTIG